MELCCRCDESMNLRYYEGDYYCERCLFDKTYDYVKGLNFIVQNGLVEDFEGFDEEYQGSIADAFNGVWNINCEVREYLEDMIEDYVDWLETRPSIIQIKETA